MRRVLKIPVYRRLLAAYTLNELAIAIGSLALAVLTYRRTGSAIGAASFFLAAQFLPALISPAVLARIDQLAARPTLTVLYALEAIAYLGLALLASNFSLAPLLALTFIDGVLALTARAVARTAGVAVTAPAGLLREGNALANAVFSICFMTGPALGALIASNGGTVAALLTNSGLFLVMAATVLSAAGMPEAAADRRPSAGRLRAALKHAVTQPAIRALLGLQAIGLLFFTISIPVEVVFALQVLHAGQGGYGALLSSWGVGTVLGSLIFARWRARPARSLITAGAALLGIGFLMLAAAAGLIVALLGGAVAGVGTGIEAVSARTALQERVEAEWMGMMMSLNESLSQAIPGIGIIVGGGLSALAGARAALAVAGGGASVVAMLSWVLLSRLSEPDPRAAGSPSFEHSEPRSSAASTR